jgi:hypothetical protein
MQTKGRPIPFSDIQLTVKQVSPQHLNDLGKGALKGPLLAFWTKARAKLIAQLVCGTL